MGTRARARTPTLVVVGVASLALAAFAGTKPMPNFSGEWTLDASKSDVPPGGPHGGHQGGGWGGGGHGGGYGGGGHHMAGGGPGAPPDSARAGRGGPHLPRVLRLEQRPGLVRLEDSTGVVLREIAFNDSAATSASTGPGEFFGGRWNGEQLEVEHTTPSGGTLVESYALEDHGSTLVVKVSMASESGKREMKRVYRKVAT